MILGTFTFVHLADAVIQHDLHLTQKQFKVKQQLTKQFRVKWIAHRSCKHGFLVLIWTYIYSISNPWAIISPSGTQGRNTHRQYDSLSLVHTHILSHTYDQLTVVSPLTGKFLYDMESTSRDHTKLRHTLKPKVRTKPSSITVRHLLLALPFNINPLDCDY